PPPVREVMETIADAANLPRPRLSVPMRPALAIGRFLERAFKLARAKRPPPVTAFVVTQLTRDIVYDANKAGRVLGWAGGAAPVEGMRRWARFHAARV